MIRLLLARHGVTDWNLRGLMMGWSDIPLNERGEQQARALAGRLADLRIEQIYASDLLRARRTAEMCSDGRGLPLEATRLLREFNFGEWEGLTISEVRQRDPIRYADWEKAWTRLGPPAGDTLPGVAARVDEFYRGLLAQYLPHAERGESPTLLVVSHAGPIQLLIAAALGLGPEMHWRFYMEPCSLSELLVSKAGGSLRRLNDTSHLARLPETVLFETTESQR